jgi:hypothetical protein
MSNNTFFCSLLIALGVLVAGCHKEATTASAAGDLEKTFNLQSAKHPTAAATPSRGEKSAPPGDDVQQAVSDAVTAMRNNSYLEAFQTLHTVQAAPKLTLNQYSAIESARLAVERDIAGKALAGDPAALKALESIKKAGH